MSVSNPKRFWRNVKAKLNIKTAINDLRAENRETISADKEKAETLIMYFCSMFATEQDDPSELHGK